MDELKPNIVIDTNVLVAALRSSRGASHQLMLMVGEGKFDISLSVPLVLEYEDVCRRSLPELSLTEEELGDLVDYLCRVGRAVNVFFRWRPELPDPKDDLVLELAVAGRCDGIVTFNKRDFSAVANFGLSLWTPGEFLRILEPNP